MERVWGDRSTPLPGRKREQPELPASRRRSRVRRRALLACHQRRQRRQRQRIDRRRLLCCLLVRRRWRRRWRLCGRLRLAQQQQLQQARTDRVWWRRRLHWLLPSLLPGGQRAKQALRLLHQLLHKQLELRRRRRRRLWRLCGGLQER